MGASPMMEEKKTLVNVKDASWSLMMGIPTEEWDDLPSPGLMICNNSLQEVFQTDPVTDKTKEAFLHNNGKTRVMHVEYTILPAASEAINHGNWRLIENKSTCNAFINVKYLSNIWNAPDGQYIHVHCNAGITHTNKIGDQPGYSNIVWYNPKGIFNILSLRLVQKHHIVTYNSQGDNEYVINSPQRPTFNTTTAGLF